MVKKLQRKLIRDLWRMKMQVITIALVIASGVGALVGFLSTQDSLKIAQTQFYQRFRFANIFGELSRAPQSIAQQIQNLPGVATLETRISKDFLLHLPQKSYTAVGRFISIPTDSQPRLNKIYLRSGRWLDPETTHEALVSEGFAEANGFKPGDKIAAIINGKYQSFDIVGIALSPEYIYAIRGDNPIPDDRQYGIFWTSQKTLESALNMEGSFNSFSLSLGYGNSEQALIDKIDHLLLDYGGLGAYGRSDQVSHRFISDEINQNRVMAVVIPFIFLSVAAFLLNVVMSRIVGQQRSQIASLKAVGYHNKSISLHYIKFVTIIVFLGAITGSGLGAWIGIKFTQLYGDYYRFPNINYTLDPKIVLFSFLISLFAAWFAIFRTLKNIYQLQPAEAMRPPNPPSFRQKSWEKKYITSKLSNKSKMIYRNLTTQGWKTSLSILGMASALMITTLGMFWWDTIDFVIDYEFFQTNREDALVTFIDRQETKALWELEQYPGILVSEGYHSLPVRIYSGHKKVETALVGYPKNSKIRFMFNDKHQRVYPSGEGIMLSHLLAQRLKLKPGDWVHLEVLEGKRQKWFLPVSAILYQWVGYSAYIDLKSLQNLLDENSIRFAVLKVDALHKATLQEKLKFIPKVVGIHFKRETLRSFKETMVKFILVFASSLTIFAFIIAFGVVYNSIRVTLSEREWELMSLRVMGFNVKQVFLLLTYEMLWQIVIALPLGWGLSYLFAKLMVTLMHTEAFDIPLVIHPKTFAYASLVIIISAILSSYYAYYRLKKINIVSALKIRE
ncbi:MAG: ABC transporter permease [Deltaproteobacteria bacterium]|nr:ABC transporter permease [Deltaproteobacteria bacterium]